MKTIMKKNVYIQPSTDVDVLRYSQTLCQSLGIGDPLGGGDNEENAQTIP